MKLKTALITALSVITATMAHAQIPDYAAEARALASEFDLTTHVGTCAYVDAVARKLYTQDSNFGHLHKRPGQNGCDSVLGRHAVDAVLYRSVGKTVDLVADGGGPDARPQWLVNVNDAYTPADWFAPSASLPEVPDVPPAVDLTPILARLAALETYTRALQLMIEDAERRLQAGLDILAARPVWATCRASVLRFPVSCRLEVGQ